MTRRERKAAYKAQMEREREEWLAQQREAAKAYKALCSRKMVAELRLLKHGCLGFPPNLFGMTMQGLCGSGGESRRPDGRPRLKVIRDDFGAIHARAIGVRVVVARSGTTVECGRWLYVFRSTGSGRYSAGWYVMLLRRRRIIWRGVRLQP